MKKQLAKILTPNTKDGIDNLIELVKKAHHGTIDSIKISFEGGDRNILHWNNEDVTIIVTIVTRYKLKGQGTGYRVAGTLIVFSDIEAYYLECLKYDFNQEDSKIKLSLKEYKDGKYVVCKSYEEIDLVLKSKNL